MAADREIYVTEIARFFPPQGKWTVEDFFALPETNSIVELSHGRLIVSPSPDDVHQTAVEELFYALKTFVDAHDLGRARVAPFDVRLSNEVIRQPDVFFVRKDHLSRIQGHVLRGAPDLVAEVISPGTRKADEVEKLAEYAEAGIPEYWLLDSKAVTIRVYVLPEGASEYILNATYQAGEIARSITLTGFEIAVDKIFPDQSDE
jgi:Uma2 family endonuclease